MIIATQVEQAVDAAEAAATKLEEEEDVVEMTETTATADVITAVTPRSTAGTTAPFASRTNRLMKPNILMLHRLVPQRHLPLTLGDDHRERRFRELSGCRWRRSGMLLESR